MTVPPVLPGSGLIRPCVALLAILLVLAGFPREAPAETHDTCAGFIDSVPAVISTQGVWCLRGDVSTAQTSGSAIEIAANNVTIDCNGYKIGGLAAGSSSAANGIYAYGRMNITVRNCNIRGFLHGISLFGSNAGGHLVEDNRLDGNLYVGMDIYGDNNTVQRNQVYDTGGGTSTSSMINYGIYAQANVIGNIVDGIDADRLIAIRITGAGHVARDNVVRNILSGSGDEVFGIFGSGDSILVDNHVYVSAGPPASESGNGVRDGAVCLRNTVYGFATPFANCDISSGNKP